MLFFPPLYADFHGQLHIDMNHLGDFKEASLQCIFVHFLLEGTQASLKSTHSTKVMPITWHIARINAGLSPGLPRLSDKRVNLTEF